MTGLLSIFAADIFPIFAIAAAGYLLARYLGANVKTVSHVVFYVLSPCLLFTLLTTTGRSAQGMGRLMLMAFLMMLAMGVVGLIAGAALRLSRPHLRAFLIVVMFSNVGNFGLPVLQFAFGTDALAYGSVFFLTFAAMTYTIGAYIAAGARGTSSAAFWRVLKMPALYGVALAMLVIGAGVTVPLMVMRPVAMLSDATLPLMILVLGMQLERAVWPARPVATLCAVLVSLVVAPLVALGLASLLDLSGPARQAAVMMSAMPAAVANTILALEFDLDPNFVTSTVFLSTMLSPFTLTPLIAYLQ
jgi:predicted permease